MSLFRPTAYKKHITAVSVSELKEKGIKAVLLDVDNTLTAHNSQELDAAISSWLLQVQQAGLIPVIVSNGNNDRVRPFAEKLGLPYTPSAAKPLPFGFLRAAKQVGVSKSQCMVIGDQIFTDVLGANLAGMPIIQVVPLALDTENKFIQFKRKLEKIIMWRWPEAEGME